MSIKVRFVCGHSGEVSETATLAPTCGCGETRVARTFASPPRFTGSCSGPYAQMKAMEPGIVNVAPSGPLVLKPPKE